MRHGSTDNVPDPPLNFIGLTEAQMASEKVAGWKVTHFYSSPSKRCLSTAKILAKPYKSQVTAEDCLKDDVNWQKLMHFVDCIKNMDGASVLAVTHASVMKAMLINLFKVDPHKADAGRMNPLSYSVIEFEDGKAKLDKPFDFMFSESSKGLTTPV
jgi:broad specificity phosphatase PhoE